MADLTAKSNPSKETLFVSRAGADADFAAVVGAVLEAAGYDVVLQQWDFANRNFIERMHSALASGARVLALLSPEYLRSDHCQAEWQNAIADDPLNAHGRLILLRVAECEPAGLLSALAYWDLVPVRDDRALLEAIVLDAVRPERERGAPGQSRRPPRTIVDGEAIRPVPSFSGRETELAAIEAALEEPGAMAVVCGLGGAGKSSVAREYAWRNRESYSVIWWLNAQTEDAIVDGLLRLGSLFVRGLERHADRRAAAQQVTGSVLMGFAKPVLLIFDNLEHERLLRAWLPRSGAAALVTSRNSAWGAGVTSVALPAWPAETASKYLARESGRADLAAGEAAAIAEALGALPLAMAHAAAALRSMRMMTPQRYLARINDHLKSAPASAEYPNSVFATFNTAIAQAEEEAPGAAAVVRFAACFAPDAIPDELFRQPADPYPLGYPDDDLALDGALGALDRLSLLAFAGASRTYSMHRLVQHAAREIGGDGDAWVRAAVAAAEASFPDAKHSVPVEAWPQCERLTPHARAALEALPDETATAEAARLASRCATYLRERGEYAAAEPLLLRALRMAESLHGPEHPETALISSNLAVLYWQAGRYGEAERRNLRALEILEASLGAEHPDVATALNNLGLLYNQQGRYAEAEPLLVRALAIRERGLGPGHPNVAASLNNLAIVYCEQRRFEEGEPLQARALAIREKSLGPDHPHVANGLNNLAAIYYELGRFAEAEPLHRRALDIWERALGPEHSDVAMALHNLADDYFGLRRYAEAEPLQRRALAIWEKALGSEHEYVALSLRSLALLSDARSDFGEGETLHLRALAILERSLGREHLKVATTLRNLARSHRARGNAAEAQALYARALAIRESALGGDDLSARALREEMAEP